MSKKTTLQKVYNKFIRDNLPKGIGVYNGVTVLNDVPIIENGYVPDYKAPNIQAIREYVSSGDSVTILGGGKGVTTVIAANESGKNGEVISYEASKSEYKKMINTVERNETAADTVQKHAAVGPIKESPGEVGYPVLYPPRKLEYSNVLEMDIEGAEKEVLKDISAPFSVIIVETHPENGSESTEIIDILDGKGYAIESIVKDKKSGHVITAVIQ